MIGSDGRKKYFIDKRFALYFALFVLVISFILLFAFKPQRVFDNCSQAKAAGQGNFKLGSKDYRPSMDRDHDGTACEL